MPEANYHVIENPNIAKVLDEGSSKAEKEEQGKAKKRTKEKEKTKEKAREKAKKQKSDLVKLNLIGGKTSSIYKGTM